MLKIQCISDLHLEFSPIYIPNAGADILVLSGDICVADFFTRSKDSPKYEKAQDFRNFFRMISGDFEHIFYILGNHEHYHGTLEKTVDILRNEMPVNITILDHEYIDFGGYRFIGGTLWTDFDKNSPSAMYVVEQGLNDYRYIKTYKSGYGRLRGLDTLAKHRQFIKYIDDNLTEKTVIIGHHGPSWASISPEYVSGRYAMLNPGYVSDLGEFILDRPEIKLWTHGHVHSSHDYMIGNTRIFANPRGYNTENKQFNPEIIIDLD